MKKSKERYGAEYRLWRKHRAHKTAQYVNRKSDDDDIGDILLDAEGEAKSSEFSAFSFSLRFLGIAALIYTAAEALFVLILPYVLEYIGVPISLDVHNGRISGNRLVLDIYIFMRILVKNGAVLLYGFLGHRVKFGLKAMTKKPQSLPHLKAAVPVALLTGIVAVAFNFLLGATSINLQSETPIEAKILIYILLYPLLNEFVFRGLLLFTMRQYGDVSGIFVTSFVGMLLTFNVKLFPSVFLIGLVLGYFTLSTRSIITPIFMQIIISAMIIGSEYLKEIENTKLQIIIFSAAALLSSIAAMIALALLMTRYPDKIETEKTTDLLSPADKVFAVLSSFAIIMATAAAVVMFTL
ncbi:MAG: CPBP family intramembrane metalloprotease [Ruminococcus sp.]|jgi:membrane protease YdiL (CAAX protease family)|nr:CPBP family intramembrane metalloprotease [Ruminococcus sp.]